MTGTVDVVAFNLVGPERWRLGRVFPCATSPAAVCTAIEEVLRTGQPDAVLLWDFSLGEPSPDVVAAVLLGPGDLWHAGLRLGLAGQPGLIDFFMPTWMLNRDPDSRIEATSWRVSLRACLVRSDVLRQLGSVRRDFETMDGASLELGHRFIQSGVIMRHVPALLPQCTETRAEITLRDEVRFIGYRAQSPWRQWALMRAMVTGYRGRVRLLIAALKTTSVSRTADKIYQRSPMRMTRNLDARVTVLIPTVDRYPYLRTLLGQLRNQTVPPVEVIVIDQTPVARRDLSLLDEFRDLPVRLFKLDEPGQCSSRNLGLLASKGDYILFLDDDDEVHADLIEQHLSSLEWFGADVSNGVAHEVGAGSLPEDFTYVRASNVFPTNNTLVRRQVLERSGLFDLAFDHGQRADADLGARVYYSGALMVLSPEIAVLHHHAPQGGLRTHKARVVTFAGSRKSLWIRHLPTKTEAYLAQRYFSPRQATESFWIRAMGTFGAKGNVVRKLLKAIVSAFLLPHTLSSIAKTKGQARQLMGKYPEIPVLVPAKPKVESAAHASIG